MKQSAPPGPGEKARLYVNSGQSTPTMAMHTSESTMVCTTFFARTRPP